MRAILVASSPNNSFEKLYLPKSYDLIVGVDGGCSKITKYQVDIAFGDFDSLTVPVNAEKVYRYKKEKDETDLELAVEQIIKMDDKDQTKRLAGAEFTLKDAKGNVVKEGNFGTCRKGSCCR